MASRFLNPYIDEIKKFSGLVFIDDECFAFIKTLKGAVDLDIGCGNGEGLVFEASRNKDRFYIGVELQYKEVYRTALKIQKAGLKNCVVFKIDAKKVPDLFGPGQIAGVSILFPDPWPKAKQKKNRLIQKDYVLRLSSKMLPGTLLRIRTDNDDYFQGIVNTIYPLIDDLDIQILEFSRDYYLHGKKDNECITAFERIFLGQGLLINALYLRIKRPYSGNV